MHDLVQGKELLVERTERAKAKVALKDLIFGHSFSDHMLVCEWTQAGGWDQPVIKPFGDLSIPPSASVLHYAIEVGQGDALWVGERSLVCSASRA